MSSDTMQVDLALYGPIAKALGGKHIARMKIQIRAGTTVGKVLGQIGIKEEDTGYTLINAVLCDVPGLNASREYPLADGDHVGIFSLIYTWPYQYRDGIRMSERLKKTLSERGALHHSYSDD